MWKNTGFCLLVASLLVWPGAAFGGEGKKYAVLAGVKEYDDASFAFDLKYPENDVEELGNILRAAGFEVVVLTNNRGKANAKLVPTRKNINDALESTLDKCNKTDLVLVALAGHGELDEKEQVNYFFPKDARPRHLQRDQRERISLENLYKQLGQCGAGTKLLLVDACRTSDGAGGRNAPDPTKAPRPPKGVAVLYSCSAREIAWEFDAYRHGVFFHHVLAGLRGNAKNRDGTVTWDDLASYVRRQVPPDVSIRYPGKKQSPSLSAGDFAGAPPILINQDVKFQATPALAILLRPLSPDGAETLGLKPGLQPVVDFVVPGGGGDVIGLQADDLILRVNGQDVNTVRDFVALLKLHGLDERLEILALRKGKKTFLPGKYRTNLSPEERFRRVMEEAKEEPAAMFMLAGFYQSGNGVKADQNNAGEYYKKAADRGHSAAQVQFARILLSKAGGKRLDSPEAKEIFQWFAKSALRGDPEGQLIYSECFEQGFGVEKNEKLAKEWLKKASDRGHPPAQARVATSGLHSVPIKPGTMELDLEKFKPEFAAAVELLRKAADQDDTSAQYQLWRTYSFPLFLPDKADPKEAVRWLRIAAANGHATAQNDLGQLLEKGTDWLGGDIRKEYRLAPDNNDAFAWYEKATNGNSIDGFVNYARCLANGIGVKADPERALAIFKAGADQLKIPAAMYHVGHHYEIGLGVQMNRDEALVYYRRAATAGYEAAKKKLKDLGENP